MSKIFIYYSLTGNGDAVADYLKDKGYEILKLQTKRKNPKHVGFFTMMHYGRKATFRECEELLPYAFEENNYEKIIIGTPVWADRIATPLNSFFKDHPLTDKKPLVLFYSGGGTCKKGKADLLKICPSASSLDLLLPKKNREAMAKALEPLI
jgi:hypothetical protein